MWYIIMFPEHFFEISFIIFLKWYSSLVLVCALWQLGDSLVVKKHVPRCTLNEWITLVAYC